jgi:hypothetical protein
VFTCGYWAPRRLYAGYCDHCPSHRRRPLTAEKQLKVALFYTGNMSAKAILRKRMKAVLKSLTEEEKRRQSEVGALLPTDLNYGRIILLWLIRN